MTVGIAAKAEGGQAIVVVLDRQRTNDLSGLKIDDVDAKGFQLGNGWMIFYAGIGTFAESVAAEAGRLLKTTPDAPRDVDDIRSWIVKAYQKAYDDHSEVVVFHGRYDRQKYIDKTYAKDTLTEIESLIVDFDRDDTADLLVCGFDAQGEAQIIKVTPGSAGEIAGSYAAIGIGQDVAEQQLAYRKAVMSERLPRVVYEVLEAKFHSENAYVGAPTDAFVLVRTMSVHLSDNTKDDLRGVMSRYDAMPIDALAKALAFYELPAERKSEGEVPQEWARVLIEDKGIGGLLKQIDLARTYGVGQTPPVVRFLEVGKDRVFGTSPSSSIGSVPPSSQLPNDEKR